MAEPDKAQAAETEKPKLKEAKIELTPEQLSDVQRLVKKQAKGFREIACPRCGQKYYGKFFVNVVRCGKCNYPDEKLK